MAQDNQKKPVITRKQNGLHREITVKFPNGQAFSFVSVYRNR